MTNDSLPSLSIAQQAKAIYKAIKKVQYIYATRQVNDALGIKNGLNTLITLNLPLQSEVRVWHKKKGWRGPYKLIAINGQTCTIQMPYGPTQFRLTVVKPYYKDNSFEPIQDALEDAPEDALEDALEDA